MKKSQQLSEKLRASLERSRREASAEQTQNTAKNNNENTTNNPPIVKSKTTKVRKKVQKIERVSVSLYEKDIEILDELSIFMMSKKRRPSRSQIIKVALRSLQKGDWMIKGFDEICTEDRRRKDV